MLDVFISFLIFLSGVFIFIAYFMRLDNIFFFSFLITDQELEEPDSPWLHYLLLRAVGKFHSENGCYPGLYNDNFEADIGKLKVIQKLE